MIALGLAVLHLVMALAAFNPAPHVGGDNGAYVSLARSLLERGQYLELWDPSMRPHTQYPPVFPGILALAMAVGIKPWVGLKLVVVAFSVGAVALSYLWLRRVTTPVIALFAGLFLAVAPGVLDQAHWELSDTPFWTFTMLALWAFAHAPLEPGRAETKRDWKWLALGIAATVLAYFTRSAGLPLVVSVLAWMALRRRWKPLLAAALAVGIPAVLWWMRGKAYGAPGYLSSFWAIDPYRPSRGEIGPLGLFPRAWTNLTDSYIADHLPNVFFGGTLLALRMAASVVLVLALIGWARRLRRPGVAEGFFLLYGGLVLVWPVTWSGTRFVIPLLPFLVLYAGEVVRDAAAQLRRPLLATGAVGTLFLATVLFGVAGQVISETECRAEYAGGNRFPCMMNVWQDLFSLAEAMRGRLPEGSVVVNRKPTLFYVMSGYRGRVYPLSADPDTFFKAADEIGAKWVVVDQVMDLAPRYLHPVLLARRDDFCVVPDPTFPEAALARIDTAGPPRPPNAPPNAFRNCPLVPVPTLFR
ncbi:MAG TPA: glycosyltransferase family 39 protein [Longimicrobium sp.]|nr:glycosyltransferase family 39 protein [Longimicrobium sp.]